MIPLSLRRFETTTRQSVHNDRFAGTVFLYDLASIWVGSPPVDNRTYLGQPGAQSTAGPHWSESRTAVLADDTIGDLAHSMMIANIENPLARPYATPGAVRKLLLASAAAGVFAVVGMLASDYVRRIPSSIAGGHSRHADPVAGSLPRAAGPVGFRPVTPLEAQRINAAIPVAAVIPAATPFGFKGGDAVSLERAVGCLTSAIYYEAARESPDGQRAVAQVVLNRVRHPGYPNSVCGVVFEGQERLTGCQFSFTCDGARARMPVAFYWRRSRRIAEAALSGSVYGPVGWATHYHANHVVPYWSSSLTKVAAIGSHIFYRWKGGWGEPTAFRNTYAGIEPDPNSLWAKAKVGGTTMGALEWRTADATEPMRPDAQRPQVDGPISRFVLASRGPGAPVTFRHTPSGDVLPGRLRWSLNGADGDGTAAAGGAPATGFSSIAKDRVVAAENVDPPHSTDGRP